MANGLIDSSTLTPVRSQPHLRLAATAEASLARVAAQVRAQFGWVLVLTDAYRTYAVQEQLFRQRYTTTSLPGRPSRVWQGRRWYLRAGYAAAAVPGTSNHGTGIAVDVADLGGFTGTRYRQFASVAEPDGWSNAEGRTVAEAWHWNHLGGGTPVTNPIGGGGSAPVAPGTPAPTAPKEWDEMASKAEIQQAAHDAVVGVLRAREFKNASQSRDVVFVTISGWYVDLLGRPGSPDEIGPRVNAVVDKGGALSDQYAAIFRSSEATRLRAAAKTATGTK